MKIRTTMLMAALALFLSAATQPATAQQNIKGLGTYTCGQFAELFESVDEAEQTQLIISVFSWFQGYATGKNLERPTEGQKDLTGLLPDMILTQVGAHCAVNEGASLYLIANAIYENLPAFAGASI